MLCIIFLTLVFVISVLATYIATKLNGQHFYIIERSKLIIRERIEQTPEKDIKTVLQELNLHPNSQQKALRVLGIMGEVIGVDFKRFNYGIKLQNILEVNKEELAAKKVKLLKRFDLVPSIEPFTSDFEHFLDRIIDSKKEKEALEELGVKFKNADQLLDFYYGMNIRQFIDFCVPIIKENIK